MVEFNLKTAYVPESKKKKEGFFKQIDEYIKSKKKGKEFNPWGFGQMARHLAAFQEFRKGKITFASFDYQFYEDFLDYLTFEYP